MTPTEIYEEAFERSDPVWPEDHEWENVHDGQVPRVADIARLIERHINASEVIVLVHTPVGIGARLARDRAANYIANHVLEADIQVSDPLYTCFVAILRSGVATGWAKATHKPVPYRFPGDA